MILSSLEKLSRDIVYISSEHYLEILFLFLGKSFYQNILSYSCATSI